MTSIKRPHMIVKSQGWRTGNTGALSTLVDLYKDEIAAHRRVLREQAGYDLGWEWAAVEWLNEHCPQWRLLYWNNMVDHEQRGHYLAVADHRERI
jgi:hypothetical protein